MFGFCSDVKSGYRIEAGNTNQNNRENTKKGNKMGKRQIYEIWAKTAQIRTKTVRKAPKQVLTSSNCHLGTGLGGCDSYNNRQVLRALAHDYYD